METNQSKEDKNKVEFLMGEYSNFWMGVLRTEGLLNALKKMPEDMILKANQIVPSPPGLPPTVKNKVVKDRIEEVERDNKVLVARLEAIKEMLKKYPGGVEAIKEWKWSPEIEKEQEK